MVRIELTNENTPEEVIVEAHRFGTAFLESGENQKNYIVNKPAGFYLCNAILVSKDFAKVRILDFAENYFLHPRSGKIQTLVELPGDVFLKGVSGGGYQQNSDGGFTEVAKGFIESEGKEIPYYIYPAVDDDHATFYMNVEDTKANWTTEENYGNVWWVGEDGEGLSWKGTPNRLIPIPVNYLIPGVMQATGYNTATCFSKNIYYGGAVLCEAPPVGENTDVFVAGACYVDSWLICISHQHVRSQGDYIYVHKSEDNGTTWILIGTQKAGAQLLTPAFISQDGRNFSVGNKRFSIDENLELLTLEETIEPNSTGNKRLVTGSGYSYDGSYSGLWPGLDQLSNMKSVTATVRATLFSDTSSSDSSSVFDVPVVRSNPATEIGVVATGFPDPGTCSGIGISVGAVINGDYCSIEWSGDVQMAGQMPIICVNGCCGTATATIQPQGLSATYTAMLTANQSVGSPSVSNCTCANAGTVYSEMTCSGRTKYTFVTVSSPDSSALKSSGFIEWAAYTPSSMVCDPPSPTSCEGADTGYGPQPVTEAVGTYVKLGNGIYQFTGYGQLTTPWSQDYCSGGFWGSSSTEDPCASNTSTTYYECFTSSSYQIIMSGVNGTCTYKRTTTNKFQFNYSRSVGSCDYLGELSGNNWYDVNNNPIELPALASNEVRYICSSTVLNCG